MNNALQFGQWLRQRRKALDLTQEDMAECIGCSDVAVRKIERGQRRPSRQMAQLFAQCLKIPDEDRLWFLKQARGADTGDLGADQSVHASHSLADTTRATHTNLPLQPTPFIGREKEVAAVRGLLWRAGVRLVTLTGPGGIGKTRLGLEVALQLLDDFEDGAFFVALAPIMDPGLVASTIARVLGVKEAGNRPIVETLKSYLHDKQMLLVLDNFEQVIDAALVVAELVADAPRLKVLVTSREVLNVQAEHNYLAPPLDLPDTKSLPPLENLTRYEAVHLFTERAAAVKYDFEVTDANASVVAQICVRLDGLPLSLELAAARVRTLPLDILLDRLSSRLEVLTEGARDLPARQQTLRSTIEWSYDLLNEGEKQLFRRMSVFQGGWTLEGLEAVSKGIGNRESGIGNGILTPDSRFPIPLNIDVLDGVESLVNKSLVQQKEGRDGEARFWMLETIREFAREKLAESGEVEALQREHALYFLRLAEEAEPHLTGAQQTEWLAQLEDEHDNLRAALRWAREQGSEEIADTLQDAEPAEVGLRIAGVLWRFWEVCGYLSEGREQVAEMLALSTPFTISTVQVPLPQSQSQHSLRAKALNGAGILAQHQGDYVAARSLYQESLAIRRKLGDKSGVAASLNNLGLVAYSQGDYADARSLHDESLSMYRELGDKRGIAVALNNLGHVAFNQGDYASARSLFGESLAIRRELGDKHGIAASLNSLGIVNREQGDYASARSLFGESLAIRRELGNKEGIAWSLNNLGHVAYSQGDYATAHSLYQESLAIKRKLGDKRGIAVSLVGLGGVAGGMGQAPQHGATLLGAAEALLEIISAVLDPSDRIPYEQGIASTRAQLSEEEFERAWAGGRTMTMEQAIAYALEGEISRE